MMKEPKTGETMDTERILVVDDDENILKILTLYLRSKGYDVVTCKSGARVVSVFDETHPDLVLLDVMLPGMDGWKVLETLRKFSDVPVIMLTALGRVDDRIHGLDHGADDYIVKPFDSKELIARVRAVLRRSKGNDGGEGRKPIEFADLSIDLDNGMVKKNGNKVDMTPKETELLYYLATHMNHVVSRGDILDAVWGHDYYGDGRTVDVHIRRIRERLGEDNAWKIVSVWGVGYLLEYQE